MTGSRLFQCDQHHFIDVLRHREDRQGDDVVYTFLHKEAPPETMTYARLAADARRIGRHLLEHAGPGDRVLLILPPGLAFVRAFFGCLYGGLIAVPGYPPTSARDLTRATEILLDCQAKVILSTSRILDQLRRLPEDHQLPSGSICIGIDHIPDGDVALLDPRVEASSAAILQYTSGSASKPKGVIVSHGNLLHNSECIRHRFGHTSQSQGVIWLPPYHDMGLIGGILQPLYSGFPVALMSPLTFIQRPLRWLRAISEYAATTSGGPNFAFQLCIDQISDQDAAELDLASWRVAFTGGEQVRRATLRAFAEKFRPAGFSDKAFLPCYGMAETTLMLSGRGDRTVPEPIQAARSSLGETASGTGGALSMGPIVADMDAVIVDPATCRRCPDGVEGEIWVRGPSVAHGYWNQPQAIGLLTASIEGDAGGYLRTGDLGFMHAGELHITGRIKDMIIIHGMNHYPHDLEETVAACGGAIRSGGVAAFSVVVEDKERLVVVLEVDPRKLDHELGKILGDVREAIAEAHGIQVWELVVVNPGGVPKTSSGKLQRFAARQRYLARSFAPVSRSPMAAPAGP